MLLLLYIDNMFLAYTPTAAAKASAKALRTSALLNCVSIATTRNLTNNLPISFYFLVPRECSSRNVQPL